MGNLCSRNCSRSSDRSQDGDSGPSGVSCFMVEDNVGKGLWLLNELSKLTRTRRSVTTQGKGDSMYQHESNKILIKQQTEEDAGRRVYRAPTIQDILRQRQQRQAEGKEDVETNRGVLIFELNELLFSNCFLLHG